MLILVSCLIKIGGSYLRQVPHTGLSRLLSDYAPANAAGASNLLLSFSWIQNSPNAKKGMVLHC